MFRYLPSQPAQFRRLSILLALSQILVQAPSTATASDQNISSYRPHAAVPALADLRPLLSSRDRLATLRAIHITLTQVEDGATYVWHRRHGRLSGAFRPTASFRNRQGKTCRHLIVQLKSGLYNRRTEGIACRTSTGGWRLEG